MRTWIRWWQRVKGERQKQDMKRLPSLKEAYKEKKKKK
jgi:hypothetical protein